MTKIQEVNTETQEVIIRDANEVELNMLQLQKEVYERQQVEAETKAQAKSALLEQLGITEEQAKLLLS